MYALLFVLSLVLLYTAGYWVSTWLENRQFRRKLASLAPTFDELTQAETLEKSELAVIRLEQVMATIKTSPVYQQHVRSRVHAQKQVSQSLRRKYKHKR